MLKFLFYFLDYMGECCGYFLLLYPSVFLLEFQNVLGKSFLGKMCGIHLLMVCGICRLCSARMTSCSTMRLYTLVPIPF